jgi:DNA-binding transcriptional LysR family regulator
VLQDRLHARRRRMAGAVRVTTNETMANAFLTPCLLEFADLYPDIRVELLVSDQRVDLLRGEADVAIRGGAQPDSGGLVIRKISDVAWSVFCSREYAARRGCPREVEDLQRHAIIQGDGAAAVMPGVRWLERHAPHADTPTRSNSLSNLVVAVEGGPGPGHPALLRRRRGPTADPLPAAHSRASVACVADHPGVAARPAAGPRLQRLRGRARLRRPPTDGGLQPQPAVAA